MVAPWVLRALYASLLSQSAFVSEKPTVDSRRTYVTTQTYYGELRGVREITTTNNLVDSYLGIPFALPPVGQRRFSKPEPPVRWTGMREASKFRYECLQKNDPAATYVVGEKPVEQSEDCLYLNVYVPVDTGKNQPLAVMVWIHGGSFLIGAGSHYDGMELAATGVIVVTINYRLDIFGFLSNEDNVIPGNFGMLDQIMALKWVKGNIRSFGGDSSRVTIFGESSGSVSVSLLVLSPLASGLFHRAIMESGVSLSPWAVTTPINRMTPQTVLSLIGAVIGCMDSDISKKLKCFRNVDAHDLLNASATVLNLFPSSQLFRPRVENTFSFLPDLPINLLARNRFNHVDTIRGFNTDESGLSVVDKEDDGISRVEFVQLLKNSFEQYAFTNRDAIINDIIANYSGNETDKKALRYAAVRVLSDISFSGPTIIEANIQSTLATENNHYIYEFQRRPSYSPNPPWMNATHGEEIAFVFGVNLAQFKKFMAVDKVPNDEDNLVWNQMKTFWTNFAKHGNPSQTIPTGALSWKTYDAKNGLYLKINRPYQVLAFSNTKATVMSQNLLKRLQTNYRFDTIVG